LSGATYAAFVLPAKPVDGSDAGGRSLALALPSGFALDRWRRPPIAPALAEAAAELGIAVALEVAPVAPAGQPDQPHEPA
jgi:hypothetical protein